MSYAPIMNSGLRMSGMPVVARTSSLGSGLKSLLGLGNTRAVAGAARGINWSSLLNNTSKTLGVVREAIPIVKEVGPMMNNMKSMLKVASLFNDATTPSNNNSNTQNNNSTNNSSNNRVNNETRNENTITNNSYSNSPNFFI